MKFIRLKIFNLLIAVLLFSQAPMTLAENNKTRNQEIQKEIEELMKQRDELFKSLLDDSFMEKYQGRIEDLFKKFEKEAFGDFGMFGEENIFGEYDWRDSDNERIFSLKVKQIKDQPLDIKIEKGSINIKGNIESTAIDAKGVKRVKKSLFARSFPIPSDVDQTNPVFDNKNGELLIKFKKLTKNSSSSPDKVPTKPQKPEPPAKSKDQERLPLESSSGDLTI